MNTHHPISVDPSQPLSAFAGGVTEVAQLLCLSDADDRGGVTARLINQDQKTAGKDADGRQTAVMAVDWTEGKWLVRVNRRRL